MVHLLWDKKMEDKEHSDKAKNFQMHILKILKISSSVSDAMMRPSNFSSISHFFLMMKHKPLVIFFFRSFGSRTTAVYSPL